MTASHKSAPGNRAAGLDPTRAKRRNLPPGTEGTAPHVLPVTALSAARVLTGGPYRGVRRQPGSRTRQAPAAVQALRGCRNREPQTGAVSRCRRPKAQSKAWARYFRGAERGSAPCPPGFWGSGAHLWHSLACRNITSFLPPSSHSALPGCWSGSSFSFL